MSLWTFQRLLSTIVCILFLWFCCKWNITNSNFRHIDRFLIRLNNLTSWFIFSTELRSFWFQNHISRTFSHLKYERIRIFVSREKKLYKSVDVRRKLVDESPGKYGKWYDLAIHRWRTHLLTTRALWIRTI